MKTIRFVVVSLLLGLIVCAAPAQQPASAPKLILVLSIDQMRFDYLTRLRELYKGGFKTLLDRAAVFTNANFRHASTETGPGHAVIVSGFHPKHSGIVANAWWDRFLKRVVNVVDDPLQNTLGGPGRKASPANFIGFTIGDILKQASPGSKVVGVSAKDRSAILMAGKQGDAAYWFENEGGNFVTSTYYMKAAPQWLTQFNARRVADEYAGRTWTRLFPDQKIYERYAGPDAVPAEADGKNNVFPHVLGGMPPDPLFYGDVRDTPFIDEITLTATLEAMNAHQLGQDTAPDILAIGFSGMDYIGHAYGPNSQETMDQLLRLDQLLDRLFKEVDRTIGLRNTLIVLSADHGAVPLVESTQAKGEDAHRVSPSILSDAVNKALALMFPGISGIVANFSGDVYLDSEAIRKQNLNRRQIEQTIQQSLIDTGVVAAVYTKEDLLGEAPSQDPYIEFFRNGFFEPRSPDLSVRLRKNYYLSGSSFGTGHGTAYDYDRHVPVIFYGPGIKGGLYSNACGPEDIAPTLARILGLEYPVEWDSRILTEIAPKGGS